MPQKQKPLISIEDVPIITTVAVLVVGFGTIFGLTAYSIFGINKRIEPTVKAPSINVIENNYFGNEFIQVKLPQENVTIKSPVLISGKANVFEANVRVRVKDDSENILADTFITAAGAYDKLYPFEKEISYNSPTSQNGFIEVFEESAKDGSDIHRVEIPVVFGDYVSILDWQLFSVEEYGFSMKIHPDYKKTKEEEIKREGMKMKIIVFSKDDEIIGINIDEEPNTIKMMRTVLFDAFRLGPEEWRKSIEYYSKEYYSIGLDAEFISKENIEIGACVGIQLLEKKNQKYSQNLMLTSRNLENMYITILFKYYTKDTETKILKMIKTIECTK